MYFRLFFALVHFNGTFYRRNNDSVIFDNVVGAQAKGDTDAISPGAFTSAPVFVY